MTNREFFVAVSSSDVADELKQFALDSIAKLDAKNAKRSSADSKEKHESAARRQLVLSCVQNADAPMTRDAIAEITGLTPGQVTSACSAFVKDDIFVKTEIKDGKTKHMAYAIAE